MDKALFFEPTVLLDSVEGKTPDTLAVCTRAINTFVLAAIQKSSTSYLDSAYVITVEFPVADAGKTHYYIFTCPKLGIHLLNSITVGQPSGIALRESEDKSRGNENKGVFNLAGQRLAAPRSGQINIVGGKKILRYSEKGKE